MRTKNIYGLIAVIILLTAGVTSAQWNSEWSSPQLGYYTASGWLSFKKTGDTWENRVYTIDDNSFNISSGQYTTATQYEYVFTQAEITAGMQIYSLQKDLTGDGITEFYVLSWYDTTTVTRQSFKIIDITNGSTVFEKNESSAYFTSPTIWDVDKDGQYECTFYKYDYPAFNGYTLEVYNTGVTATGVTQEPVFTRFELKQNYPNPFNPSTTIEYSLQSPGNVSIRIYDIKGELIRTLVNESRAAGNHTVKWDGVTANGRTAPSGPYFYTVETEGQRLSKKMLLLK